MKYFKINPLVLYRNYGDFGYLTDNRHFGYNFADQEFKLGDTIISESGAEIVSCLEKKPHSLGEISNHLKTLYDNDDIEDIISNFLNTLCEKGFIIQGNSYHECENRNEPIIITNKQGKKSDAECEPTVQTQSFFAQRFGDNPFPTSLHIEVVNECNERCIPCYIPHKFKTELMDESLFYNILGQAKEMNLLHITISGGEPLLHPSILNFLKLCREYDMSVNVLSNLTLLSDDILEEMSKNPLLSVQASIYSMNDETHDKITSQKGSLIKTINSVYKLIDKHIPVQISCPILKNNYNDYLDVQKWALDHNILAATDYSIIAKYDHNTDNLKCRLSKAEITNVISTRESGDPNFLKDLKKEVEENRKKSSEDYVCSICNSSICISPKGKVYPCVGWSDKILGRLQDETLQDIWFHSKLVKQLRSIKRKQLTSCMICKQKDFCTICMVRNANESPTGSPFEVSRYFCEIAKIKKEIFEKSYPEKEF